MKYNICCYFLCFAFFSFVGWAYESLFYTLQQKKLVNSGFLNGCWCPIYGIGAFIDLIILHSIQSPLKLFFAGMVLTCSLEYFVSWLLEKLFSRRWWDYTDWPLNIRGRICLLGGIAFGTLSVLLIKYIAPFITRLVFSLNPKTVAMVTVFVAAAMVFDLILTVRNMDKSDEKLWYVRAQRKRY